MIRILELKLKWNMYIQEGDFNKDNPEQHKTGKGQSLQQIEKKSEIHMQKNKIA